MPRATRKSNRAESTSSGLLREARRNEPAAWRSLSEQYEPLIRYWCRRAALDEPSCEDVVQAVLLQLSQSLAGFRDDGRKASFRRWLHAITNSRIADHRRREARQPRASGGTTAIKRLLAVCDREDDGSDGGRAATLRIQKLLRAGRGDFAHDTWQAFWLTTVENRTSAEAAAILNLTPNAVRLAKARVLKRLRELDQQFSESPP